MKFKISIILSILIFTGCDDTVNKTKEFLNDSTQKIGETFDKTAKKTTQIINDINTTKIWKEHKGKIIVGSTVAVVVVGAKLVGVKPKTAFSAINKLIPLPVEDKISLALAVATSE